MQNCCMIFVHEHNGVVGLGVVARWPSSFGTSFLSLMQSLGVIMGFFWKFYASVALS